MLDAGIIRPSTSSYASLISIVPKEETTVRICIDYRLVNRKTNLFSFLMLRIDYIIHDTAGCRYFYKNDLSKGYWEDSLQGEYEQFTAFITPSDVDE